MTRLAEEKREASTVPSIVRALVDVMPVPVLEEVAHALRGRLHSVEPPRTRRLRELRFLSMLLAEHEQYWLGSDLPYVASEVYDSERRARAAVGEPDATEAPASTTLRARFGSWTRACHAAASIDKDGCWTGPRQPWPHGTIGRRGASSPYTRGEVCDALRDCASALRRLPSSDQYTQWRMGRVARLRAQGITPRIPTIGCIYRLLAPNPSNREGWTTVLRAAFPGTDIGE